MSDETKVIEIIEKIKVLRSAAMYYYDVRSKITYVNILAAGAILLFFSQHLLDIKNGDYIFYLKSHVELFILGNLLLVAISIWAIAISNLLSNSTFNYLMMSQELEESIGIRYEKYKKLNSAVTFEFLKQQEDLAGKILNQNIWNWLNAFICLIGMVIMFALSWLSGYVGFLILSGGLLVVWVSVVLWTSRPTGILGLCRKILRI